MNAFLQEHISGMKVVQAFAQEQKVAREFDDINVGYRQRELARHRADAALYSIVEAVGSIAIAGLLWHGGSRIVAGTLTVGVRGRVHRVPGQVLRADPRPVDEVHRHAAGDGGGRARVQPARHRRARRAGRAPARGRSPSPAPRTAGRRRGRRSDRARRRHLRLSPRPPVLSDVSLSIAPARPSPSSARPARASRP